MLALSIYNTKGDRAMAKVIAFANQKGGVAKTTTTFNIAATVATRGQKVLMVDMDSQASLTISAGLEPLELSRTIFDILDNDPVPTKECIVELEHIENLSILPSSIDLAVMELKILLRPLPQGERNRLHAGSTVLVKALSQIEPDYDFIFIDCPPQLSILTLNALAATDEVIAPVKTDYLAKRGLEHLMDTVEDIRRNVNERVFVRGIIATLYEKSTKSDREILELLERQNNVLGVIKKAAAAKKGVVGGYPVVLLPNHKNQPVAVEYTRIADTIIKEK